MGVDSADLNHQNEYLSWIIEGASYIAKRFFNPILQINLVWRLFGYEKRLDQLCTMGYAYVRKILERKKCNKDEVADSSNNKNYLSNLMNITEEEGKWTDEEMMKEIQTMIMTGSD
ncbi:unnamed protein product, partial [Tenebrio molitor]